MPVFRRLAARQRERREGGGERGEGGKEGGSERENERERGVSE